MEKHRLKGDRGVMIWYVLRLSGPHNTLLYADVLDASGGLILHVELDSDDGDQMYFKEIHPDLAAKGDRRFSLDLFGPDRTLPNGRINHSHALIQFFDGAPSYDTVRETHPRNRGTQRRCAKPFGPSIAVVYGSWLDFAEVN